MTAQIPSQTVLITGGTGFIGSAVCERLLQSGYHIIVLTRQTMPKKRNIQYIHSISDISDDAVIDHCINLAGEPLFSGAWTENKKQKLFNSRVGITREIVALNHRLQQPFRTLLSGSAIGFYGDKGQLETDESAISGHHLGALLCEQWETLATRATEQGTRVCLLRTSIVLGNGGALVPMKPLFKLGLGSPISSGQQYWPWISLEDMVMATMFLLENKNVSGPVNLCSPNQVTNKQFSKTLANTLNRPMILPGVPAWLLKLVTLGASDLLTDSVKLIPDKLIHHGFQFKYPILDDAMKQAVLHH